MNTPSFLSSDPAAAIALFFVGSLFAVILVALLKYKSPGEFKEWWKSVETVVAAMLTAIATFFFTSKVRDGDVALAQKETARVEASARADKAQLESAFKGQLAAKDTEVTTKLAALADERTKLASAYLAASLPANVTKFRPSGWINGPTPVIWDSELNPQRNAPKPENTADKSKDNDGLRPPPKSGE